LHIGNKLATSAMALARINLRSNFTLGALIQLIGFGVSVAYAGFDILAG